MKAKRVLSILAATGMLLSMAGCGNTENEGEGIGNSLKEVKEVVFPLEEKQTFSSFTVLNYSKYDMDDNLLIQTIEKEANINIQFQSILPNDAREKRNLLLSSSGYPDLFFKAGLSAKELYEYGSQGILIALDDYIRNYMPNLTALMDELDGWRWITSADGHIYSLPEIERAYTQSNPYWINKKWLDNLGLKEPTNLDELYTVLKAFKEKDANGNGDPNDELPFVANGSLTDLLQYFGTSAIDKSTYLSVVDGKLTYIPTSEIFYEYLKFARKLFDEGLLNKTAFTMTGTEVAAIGTSGDVLGSFFRGGAFLAVGRDNDDDYKILTPFGKGTYAISTGIDIGGLAITDACENPEVICALFDQFYGEEGAIRGLMGIENKTYKINSDGDWEWILDGEWGTTVEAVRGSATLQGSVNIPGKYPDFWYTNMSENSDPDEIYLNSERDRTAQYGVVPLPNMFYSEEDEMTRTALATDIHKYISQYTAKVVTAEIDLESTWDEYLKTMEAMGVNRLFAIYQKSYDAAMAK